MAVTANRPGAHIALLAVINQLLPQVAALKIEGSGTIEGRILEQLQS
jgi:hypothetical protein